MFSSSFGTKILLFLSLYVILLSAGTTKALIKIPPNNTVPAIYNTSDRVDLATVINGNFPPYGRDFTGGISNGGFCNGRVPSDLIGINNALSDSEEYKTYIIQIDQSHKPASVKNHESWHRYILTSLSKPVLDDRKFLYSYNHALHGFSARLTPSQVAEIQKLPAHLATHEEAIGKLFTTHSPDFLGLNLNSGLWPNASYGESVIIGVIDTGVWPESWSFSDHGMTLTPVPQKWKGKCESGRGAPFPCNNKLIGAQAFLKGSQAAQSADDTDDSPRDNHGHGTHVSSTAAGNLVEGASQFGFASGTARGVAPRAYVAMYKVMNVGHPSESDVLAAMDQALADGVDVMSLSLGFPQKPYFEDTIAIASLLAIEKGVVVVCAAGNDGTYRSIHNGAPWITTVGAGTLDRSSIAKLTLGNGLTFEVGSQYAKSVYISDTALYYGTDSLSKSICASNTLNATEVSGKVLVCRNSSQISIIYQQLEELNRVGAYAGIIITDAKVFDLFEIPIFLLPTSSGASVMEYARMDSNASVRSMRFQLTSFGKKPAPQVAYLSSRGPDLINPRILKPDVIAPGFEILAAIPSVPLPSFHFTSGNYTLVTDYALSSGTSMAAPHVAGVTALLKAARPEWSPAAIRSAMMTTSRIFDNSGNILTDQATNLPATPLDFGAGHIDPNRAMDPGLIYDLDFQQYVDFICSLGYNEAQMKALLHLQPRKMWDCNQERADLNYPSFVSTTSKQVFNRVVTNVGDDQSLYQSRVEVPYGMNITVQPKTLSFTQKYQKHNFSVTVETYGQVPPVIYGYLGWFDEHNHTVLSPVVVLVELCAVMC